MNVVLALASRLRSSGEAVFAMAVLSIVLLLIAPLGPALLDAGIAANLALSATILVVTLFSREALRFASFPTLLLLTTLFRLALNVSSTRLVLGRGEAGRVIEAFGRVVVQGNYVVGAVVFAILTLVQLLVVAKGAERVAEVAARFTLDSLPGKQMAIDADLRAGFVDAVEARRRRRALERESQLYGAMDGALKFVKGDALAGIAIVLVNVVGGLASGAMRGMALGEAARRYTLLAIGDGLVSQIPALLVAVSAAVAVTRVAGEEEGVGIGAEIGRQLTGDPRALAAVATLLSALALAPGLPAPPFLLLAAGAAFGAHRLSRGHATAGAAAPADPARGPLEEPAEPSSRVALALGEDLLALAHLDGASAVRGALAAVREGLLRETGVWIPVIGLRAGRLPASGWELLVDELPVASGRAPRGESLSLAAPADLALVGIEASPEEEGCAVSSADAARARALGPVLDPVERTVLHAAYALRGSAHLLVGIQETQALLDGLEGSAPALVREASRQLPPSLLAEVLRRLLEEGVSIRPLRSILEAILEAGGASRGAPALAEACRRALRRQIARQVAPGGCVDALLVDPAAEAAVREALDGEHAAVHPDVALELAKAVSVARSGRPPVVLAASDLRRPLRNLLAPRIPDLIVLAYDELPPELQVRPVGRLGLAA
jgi:type III secretion protein V